MNSVNTVDPRITSIAAELPRPRWTTEELVAAAGDRISDRLRDMVSTLGVDTRHSMLSNFPDVLFAGAAPEFDTRASELAATAVRRCVEKAGVGFDSVGLVPMPRRLS